MCITMWKMFTNKIVHATYIVNKINVLAKSTTQCQRVLHCTPFVTNIPLCRSFSSKEITTDFSGHIPIEQLQFAYSRSSGAGGQHVNKVNSKVELRFNLESASWIPDDIKDKLKQQQKGRITKDGYMMVTSEKTRVQMLNKADALDKLRDMIFKAAVKPHEPSEQDIMTKQKRHDRMVKEMLRQKKNHSLKKQSRQAPSVHSL